MKFVIFYSWQSDLPNRTNRALIEKGLKQAIKNIRASLSIQNAERPLDAELVLDRDTKGVAGSPDIALTIFEKVSNSNIFVADVSIINNDFKTPVTAEQKGNVQFRPMPNPNVLLELGYAARHLRWDNIICLFNTAFGDRSELPFDLRPRRILSYQATRLENDLATVRNQLSLGLQSAIQAIVNVHEEKEMEAAQKSELDSKNTAASLRSILAELSRNAQIAGSSTQGSRLKFQLEQFQRAERDRTVASLDDGIQQALHTAYSVMMSANEYISSELAQRPHSDAWSATSDAVHRQVERASKEIVAASALLRNMLGK